MLIYALQSYSSSTLGTYTANTTYTVDDATGNKLIQLGVAQNSGGPSFTAPVNVPLDQSGSPTGMVTKASTAAGSAAVAAALGVQFLSAAVLTFGLSVTAAQATANTAAINAALAKKGTIVFAGSGDLVINGTLVCYEDTDVLGGAGVKIYRADATNANMVACAYQASPQVSISSVQAVAIAGTAHEYLVTVTFGAAHGMSAGQYCQIWGDTRNIYNGVWKIVATPSTTTLTFYFGRGNIGTPPLDYTTSLPAGAGTMTGNLAVGNLAWNFQGTLDGNGNNQADGWTHYPVYLNKIGHSRVRVRVTNTYWHAISTANDWNLTVKNSYLDSFGVAGQFYGPSRNLTISRSYVENSGDDGFAFLTQDNVGYPTVPPASHNINGDIINPTVDDCVFNRVDGSGCVTLFNKPSNGWKCDGIKVRDITCVGSSSAMLAFNGNWGTFSAHGIRFRGMQMSGTTKVGGVEKIYFMAGSQGYAMTGGSLDITGVEQLESYGAAQGYASQTTRLVDWTNQTAGTVIDRVVIDDWSLYFDTTNYNASTGYTAILSDSNMTVNQLRMANIKAKSNGGTSVPATVFAPGGMTVKQAIFDTWQLTGAALGGVTANFANTPKITAKNIGVFGAKNFIESGNYSFDLTVIDPYQTSATQGFFNFYGNGSSGTITLRVSGANITGTAFVNTPTANTAFKFSCADGSLQIDGTKATYLPGSLFYNSNAAYGAGVGLYAMGATATTRIAA